MRWNMAPMALMEELAEELSEAPRPMLFSDWSMAFLSLSLLVMAQR